MGNIAEYLRTLRTAVFGKDVRESIAQSIEQTYEDATRSGNANMEVSDARGYYSSLKNRLDGDKNDLQTQINGLASGSPLPASSVSEMTDTSRVYVNTTDGHWYWYDGTNWNDGGIYQAAENSGSVEYMLDGALFSKSKELMDYSKITENKYITNSSGVLDDSTNYNTSDYVFLEGNISYTISGSIRKFLAYTLDKNPITSSYESNQQSNYVYTPTQNCYIRISFKKNYYKIKINKTSEVENNRQVYQEMIKNNVMLNEYQLSQLDRKFYLTKIANNFNKNFKDITLTWTSGKYIGDDLQEQTNANSKYATYTINDTNVNDIFKIIGKSYLYIKPFIFVDNNNNIEYLPYDTSTKSIDFIFIPNKTGTLYINTYTTYSDTRLQILEDLIPAHENNILYKKKYVTLGDSFTHGDFTNAPEDNYHITDGMYNGELKVYPFIIGNRNLMNIINLAENGMTLASRPSGTNSIMQSENYKTIPADTDYITIKIGINDDSAHQNLPLGTIDSSDTSTFYGAYNTLLTYLITNYPNAKIGLIATNGSTNAIVNATIAIGAKYGLSVLNESTDTNVPLLLRTNRSDVLSTIKDIRDANWKVSTTPGSSNSHPNAKCHEYESTIVENWLRTL